MTKPLWAGIYVQGIYAVTLALNLVFQLLIGKLFGIGGDLAAFFVINSITTMGIVLFAEYSQLTFIINASAVRAVDGQYARLRLLIAESASNAILVVTPCIAMSAAVMLTTAGAISGAGKWFMPLALAGAAVLSMTSSIIVLIEQIRGRVLIPTLAHLVVPAVCLATVGTLSRYGATVAIPAAVLLASVLQLIYLLLLSTPDIRLLTFHGAVTCIAFPPIRHYRSWREMFASKRMLFAGLFPFLQLLERYLLSWYSATLVNASAYAWIFAMALYSLSQKGLVFFGALEAQRRGRSVWQHEQLILWVSSLAAVFLWTLGLAILFKHPQLVPAWISRMFQSAGANSYYVVVLPFLAPLIAWVSFLARVEESQGIRKRTVGIPIVASLIGILLAARTNVLLIQAASLSLGLVWLAVRMRRLLNVRKAGNDAGY